MIYSLDSCQSAYKHQFPATEKVAVYNVNFFITANFINIPSYGKFGFAGDEIYFMITLNILYPIQVSSTVRKYKN